jgi:multiple sugar transport system permease protein
MSKVRSREAIEGYLFLLPNFLGFMIFMAVPLVLSFYYSFTDYDLFNTPNIIGLENYAKAIGLTFDPQAYQSALSEGKSWLDAVGKYIKPNDPILYKALWNTVLYAIGVLIFSIIPAFILAWMLNSRLKGMTIFRAFFYIPVVASIVGSALVWKWMYQQNSGNINVAISGIVNFLNQIIFQPIGRPLADPLIGWLVTPEWALFSLVILTSWATIGYDMVIFLAALQGIPNYLFEAATVDGASRWDTLLKIVIPLLSPTIFFVLVTNTINVLQVFPEPYIMTLGGPANSTLTIVYYLYQKGFQRFQMGYGAALAWLVFAIIFIVTQAQFRVSKRLVFEE